MYYKLFVLDADSNVLDTTIIPASGKRYAILKYLRRFRPSAEVIRLRIENEDKEISYYLVEQIVSPRGKFVEIKKVNKFRRGQ